MNLLLFLVIFLLLAASIYNLIFSIVIMSPVSNKMKNKEPISQKENTDFALAIINLIVSIIIIIIILFLSISGKFSGLILDHFTKHIGKIKEGDPSFRLLQTITDKLSAAATKPPVTVRY